MGCKSDELEALLVSSPIDNGFLWIGGTAPRAHEQAFNRQMQCIAPCVPPEIESPVFGRVLVQC